MNWWLQARNATDMVCRNPVLPIVHGAHDPDEAMPAIGRDILRRLAGPQAD